DVDAFYRHRKEFGIVGLFRQRADQTYEYLAPASDCYDISCLDYGIAGRVGNFISSSNTLHKEPLLGDQCLGLFDRLAGDTRSFADAECAHLKLVPSRSGPSHLFLAAVHLLVAAACLLKIDAKQGRSE